MPKIVDSNTVTWSESSNELSATVGGDVVVDSVVIDDGGTIGSASDTDALTIAADGDVTASQDLIVAGDLDASNITVDDGGTIGSASDPDAITIAANGDVTISQDLATDFLQSKAITLKNTNFPGVNFLSDLATEQYILFAQNTSLALRNTTEAVTYHDFGVDSGNPHLTIEKGDLRIGTSGKGIDFSNASTAANILDDYEEGTWTPTVTPQSGSFTTITINDAHYTRIGRVVTAFVEWTITSVGTGSGSMFITLPFSTDNEITRMFAGGRRINDAEFIHGGASAASNSIETILTSDGSSAIVDGNIYAITITYFTDA